MGLLNLHTGMTANGATLVDQVRSFVAQVRRIADGPAEEGAEQSRPRVDSPAERDHIRSSAGVLAALRARGGRAKQSDLVADVAWSKSTVSRRLMALEESGDVVRYAVGREKLVVLPETVPNRPTNRANREEAVERADGEDGTKGDEAEGAVEEREPPKAYL